MEPAPINDSFYIKYRTLFTLKVLTSKCARRWRKRSGSVVFLSSRLCVKSSFATRLVGAHAMCFVAKNTTIPVPKVYSAFTHKGRTYILMERIPAKCLAIRWVQRSDESKALILTQLKLFVQQLRSIPRPEGVGISDVSGRGPIYDQRFPKKSLWGPFKTMADFHAELRSGLEPEQINDVLRARYPGIDDLVDFHKQPWPSSVLTHGDLSSLNILACGDDVVGIVDWETAGWMPPYWEYTSAWNVSPQNMFWQDEVGGFITPQSQELEMENLRRKYFGDI